VLAAFVQQSTVLCQRRKTENLDMEESSQYDLPDPLFLPASLGPAPHTGTCGHVMHTHCWQRYFDNILAKENRRPYRLRQPTSFDVEKQEYLCPLCECLSNTVLPLVPPLGTLQQPQSNQHAQENITFETWLQGLMIALKYKKKLPTGIRQLEVRRSSRIQALQVRENSSNTTSEEIQSGFQFVYSDTESQPVQHLLYTCPIDQVSIELGDLGADFAALFPSNKNPADELRLSDSTVEMILLYSQATYTKGLDVNLNLSDSRVPLMTWKSCAYTIHSLECLLRDMEKPLFGDLSCRHRDCLESLVRVVGVLGTVWKRPEVISSHALHLLSLILENPSDGPCVLDWDCFGVLVPLTFSLPSLFLSDQPTPVPSGNVQELNTLRLMFLSHIVKILLTVDFNEEEPMVVEEVGKEDPEAKSNILELLYAVRKAAAVPADENTVQLDARHVWTKVRMKAFHLYVDPEYFIKFYCVD
jgi:E3 ubiquitin-protein ligase UBR2